MKKKQMIKEIQKHELTLRYELFNAEAVCGETDPITIKRLRVWGAHIELMNQLGVVRQGAALKDLQEIQQVIYELTFN